MTHRYTEIQNMRTTYFRYITMICLFIAFCSYALEVCQTKHIFDLEAFHDALVESEQRSDVEERNSRLEQAILMDSLPRSRTALDGDGTKNPLEIDYLPDGDRDR
ncbi:hypothetical protein [Vibrio coralliilyticus]|uniref:hypothetical protein n=1 Tax=Vibrio coralliilyticus TaxID=190893 RepID=UPI001E344054|nr:hypothetical protein [Vibrio coralliilyticus]MCC2525778.1 hypothetical protein [Vibrio coralliilyticus]